MLLAPVMRSRLMVRQRGHDAGSVCGADLGVIFSEDDVAHPVQAVHHAPVASDPIGELVGSGLGWGAAR